MNVHEFLLIVCILTRHLDSQTNMYHKTLLLALNITMSHKIYNVHCIYMCIRDLRYQVRSWVINFPKQRLVVEPNPCQDFLTWIFLSGRDTSTSIVPASSVPPLLSTLGLSFILKSLNHDLSLLSSAVEHTWLIKFILPMKNKKNGHLPILSYCNIHMVVTYSFVIFIGQNASTY